MHRPGRGLAAVSRIVSHGAQSQTSCRDAAPQPTPTSLTARWVYVDPASGLCWMRLASRPGSATRFGLAPSSLTSLPGSPVCSSRCDRSGLCARGPGCWPPPLPESPACPSPAFQDESINRRVHNRHYGLSLSVHPDKDAIQRRTEVTPTSSTLVRPIGGIRLNVSF